MATLSKADILAVGAVVKTVSVPELGGEIRLKAFSARDRLELWDLRSANIAAIEAYENDQKLDAENRENLAPVARLDDAWLQLIFSIVDDDNKRIFSVDDIDVFDNLSYPTLNFLFSEALALQTRSDPQALKKTSE